MQKFLSYISHSRSELTKVIFPTKEQIRNAFVSVFIVVTVITLFIALVDAIMAFSLSSIL
jgi:preprotein translocase subunit SecE